MKRVLFIQNKGNSLGGIWFVNKKICEELSNRGYNVEVLSIRNNPENVFVEDNLNFNVYTINKKNLWEITHKSDLLNSIKKFKFFKTSYMYIKEHFKLLIDYKKAKRYIEKYSPDFIIISHYELLRIVPKKYLSRTIYHHHTSLIESMKNRSLKKTLYKYNNRINFLWLSQNTMKVANNLGLHNNYYIYNPIKFESTKTADVLNNNKIVVVTRFSPEKRIDLMLELVQKAFEKNKNKEWIFEIYGPVNKDNIIDRYNTKYIKFRGITNDSKKVFLGSSITLNTSIYEGFPVSLLEANECGVPAVSFNFGESINEVIIDGKTGFIAKDSEDFINKLVFLMNNKKLLSKLSDNCKKHSLRFNVKSVVDDWEKLFKDIKS